MGERDGVRKRSRCREGRKIMIKISRFTNSICKITKRPIQV